MSLLHSFDYLGYKDGFSLEKPWLFQDFDLLTFYQVTEEELNEKLGYFRSGRYKFEWDDIEFDMAEHNKLLQDTAGEVKQLREKQTKVQDELVAAENESLQKWREDKEKNKVDESTVDALLAGGLSTPLNFDFITNLVISQIQLSRPLNPRLMRMCGAWKWRRATRFRPIRS